MVSGYATQFVVSSARESYEPRRGLLYRVRAVPSTSSPLAILPRRLKEARDRCGMSQKQLGIAAGLDPFVASTRINRYERGVHRPDPVTAQRLAEALKVPAAYLFATDQRLARMILAFDALPAKAQKKLLSELEQKAAR